MRGILRAGLAMGMLTCVPAWAQGGWLADPSSQCAVFDAGGSDRVAWTGDCEDGLATGLGTATFYRDGRPAESFTADFQHGMIAGGHVISRWGNGWSYDGDSSHGRFNGGGVMVNDRQDRYLGVWTDGKLNGFGLLERADGSRYAGEWKNDLPNGEGELRRADGSVAAGIFVDGRLAQSAVPRADAAPQPAPAPPGAVAALTQVTVKDSQVHAVDDLVPAPAAPVAQGNAGYPSHCLTVESNGLNWGFRNSCDFPVQFAYCALSEQGLAGCANGGAPGSVPARGFGALMADRSLSEAGVDHNFRWVACAGGAGEVLAHLERADPPSGSCERAAAAIASAH